MLRTVTHISFFNILVILLAVAKGPLQARLLGPQGRGELAVVMVWPTALATASLMGADVWVGRLAARAPHAVSLLRRAAVRLTLALGLMTVALGLGLIPWVLPPGMGHLVGPACVALAHAPATMLTNFATAIALGRGHIWGYNLPRLLFALAYIMLLGALWLLDLHEVIHVAIAFCLAAYLAGALAAWFLNAPAPEPAPPAPPVDARVLPILRASVPFAGATMAEFASTRLPVALMSFFLSPQEIGLYSVALTAASVQETFGNAVGKALFAKIAAGDGWQQGPWLARGIRGATLVYVAISLTMLITMPALMPLVFGQAFIESQPVVVGLIPASSLAALGRIYNEALKGAGNARPCAVARIVGAVVLASVAVALMPVWGVMGMVAAVAASALVQLGILARAAAARFAVPWREMVGIRAADVWHLWRIGRSRLMRRLH